MAELIFTKENFEEEVLKSDIPVVVDFWASWCGPCRMLAPLIRSLAEDLEGEAKVGKINIDEEAELASEYNIMSVPTVMLFKDGKAQATSIGVKPKAEIREALGI